MDIHDSQRIKEIRDNTAKMADAFTRIADALERLTDRKTENSSEKPNNCEDLQDWKDRMWAEAIVTEPTISKMEQVDKDINVRSKDESQTNKGGCTNCADRKTCEDAFTEVSQYCGAYEPKTEPQTERRE